MGSKEPEILLVHRPRYDDWSFPKGKLDRGETAHAAAVREVAEETSLRVRLGPRLPGTTYTVSGGQRKDVDWWCAKAPKHADITGYRPNAEIDDVRWVTVSRARTRLTYSYDVELLNAFATAAYDSSALLVVRHAHARSRRGWRGDDAERPLNAEGKEQAHRLVPLFAAYGIKRVVSSDAVRCVDTVLPYVNNSKAKLRLEACLSQEEFDDGAMRKIVDTELSRSRRVALCSHRPVLPPMMRRLGIEPVTLEPAAMLVLHRRSGQLLSVEHLPKP
jgi:8-oxo-dGTP diphosphatase